MPHPLCIRWTGTGCSDSAVTSGICGSFTILLLVFCQSEIAMLVVSNRVENLIINLFKHEVDQVRATTLLQEGCANNIPFCEKATPEDMDRIRVATLKVSGGNVAKLEQAVELAKIDWRDLFMAAGFESDINAHNTWADMILSSKK